ncbi:MAG: hypothetical protein ACREKF_07700 [Candidatus Methylomirabilales bacterium]
MNRAVVILTVAVAAVAVAAVWYLSQGKPSDRAAYDEVVVSMSLEKATRFFATYPDSPYADQLVTDLIGWCRQERGNPVDCYRMILGAVPRDHPRYGEALGAYEGALGGGGGAR